MALLRVVLRFALRNRARFAATAVGVCVTLVAFLVLRVVVDRYTADGEGTRPDRLIVRHKNSIFFPLYTAEAQRIAKLPGVLDVSWMCWFAGTYVDDKHNFPQLAVESDSYFRLYPEFVPPEPELKAWLADPAGAIVGDLLAKRHGWKIGDRIAIKGTIYPGEWSFTLRGIYPGGTAQTDRERFFMHWKFLNEKLPGGNHVQRILVQAEDPAVAGRIDAFFGNSGTPTKTESELEVQRQWASWSDGLVDAIAAASVVVLLVLGLVLGNSMALAARESTREYAVMRAMGYESRHIAALVLSQALLTVCAGNLLALSIVPGVLSGLSALLTDQLGGPWQLHLDASTTLLAMAMGLGLSMFASAWPALRSSRANIVDALRRIA